jgi:hypothetical protein
LVQLVIAEAAVELWLGGIAAGDVLTGIDVHESLHGCHGTAGGIECPLP